MSWCLDITATAATAAIGGKARSLLRLAAAGLTVPAAFAVTDELFRALRASAPALPRALRGAADLAALEQARAALLAAPAPNEFTSQLADHLARLAAPDAPARFSVRSSFSHEDAGAGAAVFAGVFDSVVDVARDDVAGAVRRVLGSALAPGAVAYARAHGADPDGQATAVLIHRYVAGPSAGSAAFDPRRGTSPAIEPTSGAPSARARADLETALRALAARHGPVEVEWVETAAGLVFLQLRGYVAPAPARARTAIAFPDRGDWRWDAAHNPLPLSPAQAGLVALVDARCRIGIRQHVAGGYLFYAPDGPAPDETEAIDPSALDGALAALTDDLDAGLAALDSPPALDDAVELFVAIYQRIYGAIQPAARQATRVLEDFLRAHLGDLSALPSLYVGVPSIAVERSRLADDLARAASTAARAAALAAYLARFADEAPTWDVAAPTHGEQPERLMARAGDAPAGAEPMTPTFAPEGVAERSRTEVAARLPPGERARFASLLASARRARAIGEDDDWIYARAQAAVRRALLGEGSRLTRQGLLAATDEVFWLPLEQVRAGARAGAQNTAAGAHASLRAQVADARAAHAVALNDPPAAHDPAEGATETRVIHGQRASAGRVIGPAFVHRTSLAIGIEREPDRRPGAGCIIVAVTLLPSELPLLPAAGVVVESGGTLGHVAAQARERGIPALVGAAGATAAIADGDLVLLDADAGYVVKLRASYS